MGFKKEKPLFIFFIFISLLFHYSSEAYQYIDNEYIIRIVAYLNFVLYLSFKPIEVFFHEASHGLAALATATKFYTINLSWDGSGYLVYEKTGDAGMIITAFFGYAGASIWGYLIYQSSLIPRKINRFLLILFCVAFIFYSADLVTAIILAIISIVFILSWISGHFGTYLLRFIGIFIMVSALFSPTYLLNHTSRGDHIILQNSTSIPSIVWISIWFLLSLLCLIHAYKLTSSDNILSKKNN